MLSVVLIDDHAILRQGLRSLIEATGDLTVVGEADTAQKGLEACAEHEPDVAVVDVVLGEGSGIKAMSEIRERVPQTRLLALTMYDQPSVLRSVLAAGGAGFVCKRAAYDELVTAIRSVAAGRSYIGVSLQDGALEPLVSSTTSSVLTPREREVVKSIALGYTSRETAERLELGLKTVETYRSRAMQKMGFTSRVDLVRYALEMGLLREDP